MRQKLFDALKAKFPGGNATVLGRIADKLAKTVTTDDEVATAVAGVTQDMVDIIESYGDSRATEAQQTAVANYEKKHNLKDGVKFDDGGGTGNGYRAETVEKKKETQDGDIPSWVQALMDSNKQLTERLDMMDKERTATTRKQQLMGIIGQLPETLKKAYERTPVDNITDDEFNTLMKDVKTEVDGIMAERRTKGAVFGRPAARKEQDAQELSKEQQEAIAHRDSKPAEGGQPF